MARFFRPRRLVAAALIALVALPGATLRRGPAPPGEDGGGPGAGDSSTGANLAPVAASRTSYVSGHETITALNDGFDPAGSNDKSRGAYGNWPRSGTQWVEYDWTKPIRTRRIDVYWFDDHRGVRLPRACRVLAWDGAAFVPVKGASGPGLEEHRFNTATFEEVATTRLRLEMDSEGRSSTGIPGVAGPRRGRLAELPAPGTGRAGPVRGPPRAHLPLGRGPRRWEAGPLPSRPLAEGVRPGGGRVRRRGGARDLGGVLRPRGVPPRARRG